MIMPALVSRQYNTSAMFHGISCILFKKSSWRVPEPSNMQLGFLLSSHVDERAVLRDITQILDGAPC